MLEENAKDPFVVFDTLIVNLEPLQLFKDNIEIESLYLKGLDVNLTMKDSTFNFDDLIAFHTSTETDSIKTDSTSTNFKYNLSNLEVKDSNIHFDNQNIDHVTEIENFSFILPYIGWDQTQKSNADLKFNFPKGGFLASKLNINPIDGAFDAQLSVGNLQLEPFYKYVAEHIEINSFNGLLNTEILLEGNTFDLLKTVISGQVRLNHLKMTDINNKPVIASKQIDANLKTIDQFNNNYVIDSLKLTEFYTFVKLDSTSNNLTKLFKLDEQIVAETEVNTVKADSLVNTTASQNQLYYAINNFQVNNGSLDYTDNLTGKPFNYNLSQIEISSDSINSSSDWIDIYSEMLLNNRGTLNAKLGFNPKTTKQANIDISIDNFLLSDLNIYSSHYTGHNIIEGDMYYISKSVLTNGDLESENKLLVKNASLDNTKGGLYSLPLKFAIFLLKDKNGDVNLDIPVHGDLNDPSVKVSKIVWNTFKNNIIKIAASPGKLLANLVGGDQKDIEELTFTSFDSILSEKHTSQLDKLLKIEKQKEDLDIELVYYVDKDLQNKRIAKREALKLYLKVTSQKILKNAHAFEAYVYSNRAVDSFTLDQSYMAMATPQAVDSIAKSKAQLIIKDTEAYLNSVNPETKIHTSLSDPEDPLNKGSEAVLKVKYSLREEE
ncbi:MAG: hypothetical protein BM564_01300 [Bacteroidetes bacterium MedPE-SWsnd-G2]|nr:MAG: hypothetical protein BM564_01300 [Bacteroidetes bacterium MedPE-SWsnd-G2]